MKQKILIGLGVGLIGFVAMVVSGIFTIPDSEIVMVSSTESSLITGGGETGASYIVTSCSGGVGCNGEGGYIGTGAGNQVRTGNLPCGGTCTTIASAIRDAKE